MGRYFSTKRSGKSKAARLVPINRRRCRRGEQRQADLLECHHLTSQSIPGPKDLAHTAPSDPFDQAVAGMGRPVKFYNHKELRSVSHQDPPPTVFPQPAAPLEK
jgi:hypothetical protein